MTWHNHLRIGLASIKRKDLSALRSLMFVNYCQRHPLLRFLEYMYESPFWKKPVAFIMAIASFRKLFLISISNPKSANALAIFFYKNEERALLTYTETNHSNWSFMSYQANFKNILFNFINIFKFFFLKIKIYKHFCLIHQLSRKNNFLVYSRQIEFIILYSYFSYFFNKHSFNKVVISSESNPEIIAPALVLKKRAQLFYKNHGYLNDQLGYFFFDKYILSYGSLAKKICPFVIGDSFVIQKSSETHWTHPQKINKIDSILILASIVTNKSKLFELVKKCALTFPEAKIILRSHPNKSFSEAYKDELYDYENIIFSDASNSLEEDLKLATLVIAGETSSHLEAIEAGVPSAYFKIDDIENDHYGFVEEGIVFKIHLIKDLLIDINSFYQSDTWLQRATSFKNDGF